MVDFNPEVLVIGGTYDGRQIINELSKNNIRVLATITTSFGKELIEEHPNVRTYEKLLSLEEMGNLIQSLQLKCIIDASHPYAELVSQNAMEVCRKTNIRYMRFERLKAKTKNENIIYVKDYQEAAELANSLEGNILLTTGSKTLDIFFKQGNDFIKRLYVRVLPDSKVLARCEDAGMSKSNIIALKGPFSESFNIDMLKHIDAKIVITKDSGDVGGTDEKVNAGLKLGTKIIMIERPLISYDEKLEDIEEVVEWAKSIVFKSPFY